jgi:hypothetical protein
MLLKVVGALSAALLVVGVTVVTTTYLRQHLTCSDLVNAQGTAAKSEMILVEVGGNTPDWQNAVRTFVHDQLTARLGDDPAEPVQVRSEIEVQGKTAQPSNSCLSRQLLLTPGQHELSQYRRASPSTRTEMNRQFDELRKKQIDLVASAFVQTVQSTSFETTSAQQVFTPLPLWLDASEAQGDVSILSPLISNAGDCLDTKGAATPAKEVVSDCVTSGAMPKLDPSRLHVDFPTFLTAEAGQKVAVRDMQDALTTCATTSGC